MLNERLYHYLLSHNSIRRYLCEKMNPPLKKNVGWAANWPLEHFLCYAIWFTQQYCQQGGSWWPGACLEPGHLQQPCWRKPIVVYQGQTDVNARKVLLNTLLLSVHPFYLIYGYATGHCFYSSWRQRHTYYIDMFMKSSYFATVLWCWRNDLNLYMPLPFICE